MSERAEHKVTCPSSATTRLIEAAKAYLRKPYDTNRWYELQAAVERFEKK
jgi:hypothetical protein